jgi:antitoxin PrlF
MESALTAKGQTTIPKAIREHLHLAPGDRVRFFIHPDGSVVILPKIRTSALKGMIPARRSAASIHDMDAGIEEGAIHRFRRARRS